MYLVHTKNIKKQAGILTFILFLIDVSSIKSRFKKIVSSTDKTKKKSYVRHYMYDFFANNE